MQSLADYGIPPEELKESGQLVYIGFDWPSDVYDFLMTSFGSSRFRLYAVRDGKAVEAGEVSGFGEGCVWASDNVTEGSLMRCEGPTDIFATDDKDFYVVAAPHPFLEELVAHVRRESGTTDTQRALDPEFHTPATLKRYFDAYADYNVELVGSTRIAP